MDGDLVGIRSHGPQRLASNDDIVPLEEYSTGGQPLAFGIRYGLRTIRLV
jgi:hypothetical protein